MCPEFILTVQIIRALVTVNVIFFWTTKSYPIWSHFSFQIIPFKDPTEMISPSPQEWDEEKSRWKRKKSQLWSFSFHFSTYCDLHNFHYFAMFSLFSQLSVHKHLPTLLSVQSLSRVRLFVTPWITASQASLSIANSQGSPKLMCIESVMPSSHLIVCSPSPPASNPSKHQILPNDQLFAWGGQNVEVSALALFLPKNTQDWSPLE